MFLKTKTAALYAVGTAKLFRSFHYEIELHKLKCVLEFLIWERHCTLEPFRCVF